MCYRQKSRRTKQGMKHVEKECKKDTILATQQCNVSFTSHDLILLSRNTCSELAVSVSHWYVAAEREDEDSCAKHLLSWLLLNNKTLSGILSLKWHRLQIWMWLSWHDKWRGCATIDWIFFLIHIIKWKRNVRSFYPSQNVARLYQTFYIWWYTFLWEWKSTLINTRLKNHSGLISDWCDSIGALTYETKTLVQITNFSAVPEIQIFIWTNVAVWV